MINKTLGDILGAINSMTSDPYYAGITLDQENAMMQQNNADRIAQQRQAQQTAQLDAIINDGRPLDNRKLLQIMAINPEAGKMLAEQAAQKAKQERYAQIIQSDASPEQLMQVAVESGDAQLMEYAKQMAGENKYVDRPTADGFGREQGFVNDRTAAFTPLQGGSVAQSTQSSPKYAPYGDETVIGDDYPDLNTVFDDENAGNVPITDETANAADLDSVMAQYGIPRTKEGFAEGRRLVELNLKEQENQRANNKVGDGVKVKEAAKENLNTTGNELIGLLNELKRTGEISSVDDGLLSNAANYVGATDVGKAYNAIKGTDKSKTQSLITQSVENLIRAKIAADGLGSKNFDTPAEIKRIAATIDDPTATYEARVARIKRFMGTPLSEQGEFQTEQSSSPPKVGTVEGGYVFQGGDPANPDNWSKQ